MSTVSKEIVFSVGGNSYPIKRPTMGQILEIQVMKAQITRGSYGQIVRNMDELGIMSLDFVDMISTLSQLCPDLLADLKVDNWDELDPFDMMDIYRAYTEKVLPWYSKFTSELTALWKKSTDSLTSNEKESTDDTA